MQNRNPKPLLAVDCAAAHGSIALLLPDGTCAEATIAPGQQAALLVPKIDALLSAHSVDYAQLGALLTTTGPGSFTGLRIALAAVHALALAHDIPTKATTALQSVAWAVAAQRSSQARFRVALHAGKGELFVQDFYTKPGITEATSDIALRTPELAIQTPDPVYGNALDSHDPHYRTPQAITLCAMAPALPDCPLAALLPLYIRAPDAKPGQLPAWLQTT